MEEATKHAENAAKTAEEISETLTKKLQNGDFRGATGATGRRANRGFRENQEKTEKRVQEVIPDQLDHKGRQEKMRMQ